MVNLLLVITIFLALLPQPSSAADLPGPTLWLKFDETTGATSFADSGSGATNGSCAAAACPTAGATGRLGQAAQFDGANDRVTVARNAPAGSFTLAAWVRNDAAAWGDWRTIFEFGDDAPWFGVSPNGQLALYPTIFGGSVPLGKWVHVAYTWDGTANRLYIDGKEVQTNTDAPPGGGQGLGVGLEGNGASAWNGFLDDLRVYERTLSAQEIEQLAKPEAIPVIVPPPPPPTVPDNTNTGNTRLFDLTVSLHKTAPTAGDRQPYEDLFGLFADSVYELTNGAHAIRTITIYDNGRFSDRADIRWIAFENQPRASVNAYGKGRGTVYMGDAIFDANTLLTDPNSQGVFLNTLIHEWGHYKYGLFDEYVGSRMSTDPGSPMIGDTPPIPCSVMCAAGQEINFATLNFSTQKSTVGANRTNTAHYRVFQASAWDTVSRSPNDDPQAVRGSRLYWPELAAKKPAAGQDPSIELPANRTAARASLNIVWADANATSTKQRVFLVNVSADMGENNKLEATKLALKNYVDRANQGDQLAIITFADVHAVVTPFTTLDSQGTRDAVKAQIDAIQAKPGVNDRNIDAADQAALAMLAQAANNAVIVDRSVFVIIDGGYTDNTEPHIFQKIPDQQGQIPLHVFNFAATNKPNDLYSNSLELMRPFVGSYTVVSTVGFNIPARSTVDDMVDSNELLRALGDVDQEAAAILDVDLGTAYNLTVDANNPFSTAIYVDDTLDELEVAVLYEGAESGAEHYLYDPANTESDPPICDSDGIDTLCFYFISEPVTGTWTFEFYSLTGALAVDFEATGIVLEGFTYQATLSSLGGRYVSYPEEVVLVAELSYLERIAKAGLSAWVEQPDGTFADLTLLDDGVAPDETADDGVYTGFMPYDQPGDYYVTIVFDNIEGEAVFTLAGLADVDEFETRPVPIDFDRFASLEILVDDYDSDDHSNSVDEATDLPADNRDASGRIDSAGDIDSFRLTAAQSVTGDPKEQGVAVASVAAASQQYILRLSRFAQGMDATVRVTTSSGVQEHQTGLLAYDAYWTLPLDLTPGEQVLVEVRHSNGQTANGSYAVSFGSPVAGEVSANQGSSIFLPTVLR
ncbi:MAG: LamG-like jellyroll fold domain-containing protein [Caldilinea sp.]